MCWIKVTPPLSKKLAKAVLISGPTGADGSTRTLKVKMTALPTGRSTGWFMRPLPLVVLPVGTPLIVVTAVQVAAVTLDGSWSKTKAPGDGVEAGIADGDRVAGAGARRDGGRAVIHSDRQVGRHCIISRSPKTSNVRRVQSLPPQIDCRCYGARRRPPASCNVSTSEARRKAIIALMAGIEVPSVGT